MACKANTLQSSTMSNPLLSSFPTYLSLSPTRLRSLYSDFSSQKHSNPAGFQSNVDWWRETFLHLLRSASQLTSLDVLILHVDHSLLDSLSSKELKIGKPSGIGSVLTELVTSGDAIPLKTFMTSTESIYSQVSIARRFASYLITQPLWWALERLNLVGDTAFETEETRWKRIQGTYIMLPLLEEAAQLLLEHYRSLPNHSLADLLFDLDAFRSEFASKIFPGVVLTMDDIKVLVRFLERDKKVLITSKDVIKFVGSRDVEESGQIITQVDQGVLELKLALRRLHAQVDYIQSQIEDRTFRVKEHLKNRQKEMAMSHLRSKKELEKLLSKRFMSLDTIRSALLQVESAAGDIEIMKAYDTSTMTMKALLSHPLLQRDKINETMEAMAEAAADQTEVDQAIRLGGAVMFAASGAAVDEDELQKELQQIIRKEKEREDNESKEQQELELAQGDKVEREDAESFRSPMKNKEYRKSYEGQNSSIRFVEEGRRTPVNIEEDDKVWEERWLAAQAEKAVQSVRSREAELKRQAQWDDANIKIPLAS